MLLTKPNETVQRVSIDRERSYDRVTCVGGIIGARIKEERGTQSHLQFFVCFTSAMINRMQLGFS